MKLFGNGGNLIQLNYTEFNGGIQTSISGISAFQFSPNSIDAGVFVVKIEFAADDSVYKIY